jgi:hypothetical protein
MYPVQFAASGTELKTFVASSLSLLLCLQKTNKFDKLQPQWFWRFKELSLVLDK